MYYILSCISQYYWISRKYNEWQVLFIKSVLSIMATAGTRDIRSVQIKAGYYFIFILCRQNKTETNEQVPCCRRSQSRWWIWSPYLNPCAVVQGLVSFEFQMGLFWLGCVAADARVLWRAVCWSPHVAASTWCENVRKWKQQEEGEMREEWAK